MDEVDENETLRTPLAQCTPDDGIGYRYGPYGRGRLQCKCRVQRQIGLVGGGFWAP